MNGLLMTAKYLGLPIRRNEQMNMFEMFAIFTDFGLLIALMKAINRINSLQEDVDNFQKKIEKKSIDKEE